MALPPSSFIARQVGGTGVHARWEDASGNRIGSQRPRIFIGVDPSHAPTTAGEDLDAIAQDFELPLYPWQSWFSHEAMRELAEGLWAATTVGLVLPRQNGKTLLILLRMLAGVLMWNEKVIVYSAHQFATTLETLNVLKETLARSAPSHENYSPSIESWVKSVGGYKFNNHHGHESCSFGNGARIKFIARTEGKGRGFSGDCVIFDEAGFKISAEIMAALIPSLSARPNPQVWFISSSGSYDSNVLLDTRKSAKNKAPGHVYAEWSIPQRFDDKDACKLTMSPAESVKSDEYSVHDVDLWYYANPLLGIRITERFVKDVELPKLSTDGVEHFGRERLGVWGETPDVDRPIDLVMWGHGDQGARLKFQPKAIGMDVSRDRKHVSLVAVGPSGGPRVGAALIESTQDTAAAVPRIAAISKKLGLPVVVPAYGPAASYVARLKAAGVTVEIMSSSKATAACTGLADHVKDGAVEHDGRMTAAVKNVTKRWSGDSWYFDRRVETADITPVWALAVGMWYLDELDADDDAPIVITRENTGVT